MPKISDVELDNRFGWHEVIETEKLDLLRRVHNLFLSVARDVVDYTPTSREQSLALTALEEASYWAQAAIDRRPLSQALED